MTAKQKRLYFSEWGLVRRTLRDRGYSPKEADAERRELHRQAGVPDSSQEFNSTGHLDAVLEQFRAISQPDRIPDTEEESKRRRLIWKIEQLDHDEPYRAHIAHDKFNACTNWRDLRVRDLRHLLMTLNARKSPV